MLRHDDPHAHPPAAALDLPGGFLWWYAEMLDENGSGIVLIWSFGLPFLPGLQAAARAGTPWTPSEHPSLNISVYERGKLTFYALQKYTPDRVDWDGENKWILGDTHIAMQTFGNRRELSVQLSLQPAAGPRLTGSLTLTGTVPSVRAQQLAGHSADHAWTPMALPAFATLDIDYGDGSRLCTAGRAYFDRNWSLKPLDQLGIETWLWGHQHYGDHERVYYVFWKPSEPSPHIVGMEYGADGQVTVHRDLELVAEHGGKTVYGMPKFRSIEIRREGETWAKAACDVCVDNGPFYLRYVAAESATVSGGSLEVIVPKRIDLAMHRPMVRMRVNEDGRGKPPMLSFFEGPRRGRVKRLASTLGARLVQWSVVDEGYSSTEPMPEEPERAGVNDSHFVRSDLEDFFDRCDDTREPQPENLL